MGFHILLKTLNTSIKFESVTYSRYGVNCVVSQTELEGLQLTYFLEIPRGEW